MELKEFISQSITQIFEGVKNAQSQTKELNGSIAPDKFRVGKEIQPHPAIVGFVHNTPVISVEFDVSVTIQDTSKEKAGAGIFVTVLALGGQLGSESLNSQVSRLRFSVPIILPAPDSAPQQ